KRKTDGCCVTTADIFSSKWQLWPRNYPNRSDSHTRASIGQDSRGCAIVMHTTTTKSMISSYLLHCNVVYPTYSNNSIWASITRFRGILPKFIAMLRKIVPQVLH